MDVIKDKFYKDYQRVSRYATFPCYYNTLDNKYITGTVSNIDKNISYTIYEVLPGETYDLISLKLYSDPTYYWIICNFNDISDPFEIPVPGTKLKIPSVSNIQFI